MVVEEALQLVQDRLRRQPTTHDTPPVRFTDEANRDLRLTAYRESDFDALVEMYDGFDPAYRAQGVPPMEEEGIRDWLSDILGGPNVVARDGDRIVGHVSFVPDGTGRHELVIFVHQAYQEAGIGERLLGVGMGHAKAEGASYVWLTVEKSKPHLHQFYSRAGFSAVNPTGASHRMSRTL